MATAKELFDSGQLRAAIDQLTAEVKAKPTDVGRRIFLFELLCFAGQWDRAEKQLDVIGQQDVKAEVAVQAYRNNIAAERHRRRVFAEAVWPNFLVKPPDYVTLHLRAVAEIRGGNYDAAIQLLDRAEEERPALPGRFNDTAFEDFRDANDLVGPVLEVIARNEYSWLPFEQIRGFEITEPARLRDLIWTNARIETVEAVGGLTIECFIPALYCGSEASGNDMLRLGRMTEWQPINDALATPTGLRLFLAGDKDLAIFDAKKVEFTSMTVEPSETV
jgi:type VI secretion system protein ImpE